MKPFNIFSKAWQITWDNKILWAFGFLAGLYLGNNNYSNFHIQGGSWIFQNISGLFSANTLIVILMSLGALIFWFLGTLARISLIREVTALDVPKPKPLPAFMESVRASSNFLPRILLMQVLVFFPVLIVSLATHFFTQPLSNDFLTSVNESNAPAFLSTFLFLGVGGVLITISLAFIDAFAFRGIVLDELGVQDSIKAAFQIVKTNLKFILQLSIICAVIGALFAFVVSLALIPLVLFVANSLMQNVSQCSAFNGNAEALVTCIQKLGTNPNIVTVNIIASLVVAALFSIIVTLQSASFTLAYKEMMEKRKPA